MDKTGIESAAAVVKARKQLIMAEGGVDPDLDPESENEVNVEHRGDLAKERAKLMKEIQAATREAGLKRAEETVLTGGNKGAFMAEMMGSVKGFAQLSADQQEQLREGWEKTYEAVDKQIKENIAKSY